MNKKRIANKDAADYVAKRVEFDGSNLLARWESDYGVCTKYVVYSYGYHFPLLVYADDMWFETTSKFSVSTSRQLSQCRQRLPETRKCDRNALRLVIQHGVCGLALVNN